MIEREEINSIVSDMTFGYEDGLALRKSDVLAVIDLVYKSRGTCQTCKHYLTKNASTCPFFDLPPRVLDYYCADYEIQ